jgi:hypothetical protein
VAICQYFRILFLRSFPVINILIWVWFSVVKEVWIFPVILVSLCEQAWKCSDGSLLSSTALASPEYSQVVHVLYQTVTLLLNLSVNIPFIFSNEEHTAVHFV